MLGSQIFQNEKKRLIQHFRVEELHWRKAETWYISCGKANHVANRICPQQFRWHALKTSPNMFFRWSNVGSSHSHAFFGTKAKNQMQRFGQFFRDLPNRRKECASIWGHGMSHGQNDPSQKILPKFPNHFQIYGPADAGRPTVPTSFFVRTRFPMHYTTDCSAGSNQPLFVLTPKLNSPIQNENLIIILLWFFYPPSKTQISHLGKRETHLQTYLALGISDFPGGKLILIQHIFPKRRSECHPPTNKKTPHTRILLGGSTSIFWAISSKKPWSIWDFPGSQLGNTTNLRCQHDGLSKVLDFGPANNSHSTKRGHISHRR